MFLHIVALTAALHFGRRLLQPRRAAAPPEDDEPEPEDADEPAPPAGPRALPAAAPSPTEATRAEIDAQFERGLACMGVATATTLFVPQLRALGGVAVLYAGIPMMRRARQRLVEDRRVGAELLDTIGLTATIAARDFMSSAVVLLLYTGIRKLGLMTERAVEASVAELLERRDEDVWVERDGLEVRVALASLRVGDVVVVDAGEPIPADGVVVRGAGVVDPQLLTGESNPLARGVGDEVLAATMVRSGRLHVRVVTTGQATVAAELAGVLRRSADFTDALAARGQEIADGIAPPTLALGVLACPWVGPEGSAALLGSGFLDSMRLFIPLSTLTSLRRTLAAGVLVKDGRALQALPAVDTVVFDKTGTLTLGELRVGAVRPVRGVEADDLVGIAAAAEHRQSHPIARAIVEAARRRGIDVPVVDETEVELGHGLTARLGRREIHVGSRRFMAARGVHLHGDAPDDRRLRIASLVYVAVDDALLGTLELEPTVRADVEPIFAELRARGLALHLVSGDQEAPTRALARALGFDHHLAGARPADKARLVADLQARGRTVCFVGDGINDCLALGRAAVAISMHGASTSAIDSAHIVVDDLAALPALFTAAADLQRNIDHVALALAVPSAVGIAGVLFAGYGVRAMTMLHSASMLAGLAVTLWPHRHARPAPPRAPAPRERPEDPGVLDIH